MRIDFGKPENLVGYVLDGHDIYNPVTEEYVWAYTNSSIAVVEVPWKKAIELQKKAEENDTYMGEFLAGWDTAIYSEDSKEILEWAQTPIKGFLENSRHYEMWMAAEDLSWNTNPVMVIEVPKNESDPWHRLLDEWGDPVKEEVADYVEVFHDCDFYGYEIIDYHNDLILVFVNYILDDCD